VLPEVKRREGLFQHEELESIELAQVVGLFRRINAVGISLKEKLWIFFPDGLADLDVPAWFDFYLDALVTLRPIIFDHIEKVRNRILNAGAYPSRDFLSYPAIKFIKGKSLLFGLQVPEGQLQAGLGHSVFFKNFRGVIKILRFDNSPAED